MKKISSVIAHLLLASLFIPGCTPKSVDCSKPDVFCVGLVTAIGRIDDKSINQSTWEGLQLARKGDVSTRIQFIETKDGRDYDLNIAVFGNAKYDVIVTVGAAQNNATMKAAVKYPDIYFIGVDQTQETSLPAPSDLVDLTFPEDKAGYMVGALAAAVSSTHIIGAVCASYDIPSIRRFCEGYRAGAVYADSKLDSQTKVAVIYYKDGGFTESVSDPTWGAETADSLIAQGADVIFGAGGTTGNAALLESAKRGIYVIGVDVDQYYILPETAPKMLSSAIKLVAPGVAELIAIARESKNGNINFPAGNYLGMAGFAPYHDLDGKVSAKVKNMMQDLTIDLLDGTIQTEVPAARP